MFLDTKAFNFLHEVRQVSQHHMLYSNGLMGKHILFMFWQRWMANYT